MIKITRERVFSHDLVELRILGDFNISEVATHLKKRHKKLTHTWSKLMIYSVRVKESICILTLFYKDGFSK